MSIRIADLAKRHNVTHRTLRFYEQRGLVRPQRANEYTNAARLYSEADSERIGTILKWRKLGFTVRETKELIGSNGSTAKLRQKIEEQIGTMQRLRDETDAAIRELQAHLDSPVIAAGADTNDFHLAR